MRLSFSRSTHLQVAVQAKTAIWPISTVVQYGRFFYRVNKGTTAFIPAVKRIMEYVRPSAERKRENNKERLIEKLCTYEDYDIRGSTRKNW